MDEPDQFIDKTFNDDKDYDFDNLASTNFINAVNYRYNYYKAEFTSNTKLYKYIISNTYQIQYKSIFSN